MSVSVPIINSAYPNQGLLYGYTSIDISGSNLTDVTRVYFQDASSNTYDVSFTNITDTAINLHSSYSSYEQIMQIYATNTSGTSSTYANFKFTNQSVLYGLNYAIGASGGFFIEEGFPTVSLIPLMNKYDVTNALQVTYDVRKFNQLLGLIKDASNHYIIDSSFNQSTDVFPKDELILDAADFVQYMTTDQVISVGTYSTLYSDFNEYVNDYFAYGNFTPLMVNDNSSFCYDLYHGIFDASSFMHIITGQSIDTITGAYVSDVSGSITIHNVNNVLNFLAYTNPYYNRNYVGEPFAQPSNGEMYTMKDGFIDGDLIFVPEGTNIKLVLKIASQPSSYTTYNSTSNSTNKNENMFNMDIANVSLYDQCYYNNKYGQDTYTSSMNTADLSGGFYYITQNITAPLLIRLKNLSTDPYKY